jgi:hypothetical protein
VAKSGSYTMVPCPGGGVQMVGVADACPSCGRENDMIKAFNSAMDSVARSHGWESAEQAAQSMAVVGPILARQVKRAAAGLAFSMTAFLMLFEQESPGKPPMDLGAIVGVSVVVVVILYAAWWWLLGGRNTGNPFATVRAIQLWLRRAGDAILWLGLAALVFEIAFFAMTGTRLCFCEKQPY